MATFGRIPLCFHSDVRGAIAYCNNSGGFSERFSIDPVEGRSALAGDAN
jgi:hypothetical protein